MGWKQTGGGASLGSVTKATVGLNAVDNTPDVSKPVSTAQQAALDLKLNITRLGAALGAATLGADSKLLAAQIPDSLLSGLKWQSTWNAATNTPAIPAAAPSNNGFFYKASVAGTSSITGTSVAFGVSDWLISNGTSWQRVPNADAVASVNGQTGVVVLNATHVGAMALTNFGAGSKGSLVSGAGPAGVTAVTAVGTNGQILVADSAAAGGVKWSDSAEGAFPYDQTKAYAANSVALNAGLPVMANSAISAGTNFQWGTTGATWRPVLATGVWKGLFAVSTAYAVGDVIVHSMNRWAPLCRVTTAFTSEATGTLIGQARTVGGAHNSKVATLQAAQSATDYVEHMFVAATATTAGASGNVPSPAAGAQNHVFTGGGWKDLINDQSTSRYVDIGNVRIQWGYVVGTTATERTIPLPAAFGALNYTVTANPDFGTVGINQISRSVVVGGKTATQFNAQVLTPTDTGSTLGFSWQAIGVKP